jgi:hypothetical protein
VRGCNVGTARHPRLLEPGPYLIQARTGRALSALVKLEGLAL